MEKLEELIKYARMRGLEISVAKILDSKFQMKGVTWRQLMDLLLAELTPKDEVEKTFITSSVRTELWRVRGVNANLDDKIND